MSTETLLHDLSQFWHTPVPAAMARLYQSTRIESLGPCAFFRPEQILEEPERWRGMLPQFLPFGEDAEENIFGLYAIPGRQRRDYPVLWWNHEFDHYLPVASEFELFLRNCVILGRYLGLDSEDDSSVSEVALREQARLLSLPHELIQNGPPRNERELAERLAREDPQNGFALARLGGMELIRGEFQRARDFLARASEAAPWFADPYFLLAETYRVEGNDRRACELWWRVFESPVAFCSRTGVYGLCDETDDAEIYQIAADRAVECRDRLDAALKESPLWQMLMEDDPFASASRLDLGRRYSHQGEPAAAEREYLNALTLATEDDELDDSYEALILFYESAGRERDSALCRYDMGLFEDEE